ncbi:MAG TPA: hypothetical protein DCQ26_09290 [Marinilabiliales bacterium]|nr:MAG: hypothetical protein A2W95_09835 [Bacteroidetes bacterium GWA2_40_14]OFX65141.1 MAG: hypothetical protein A2W84_16795 [Bacteroidetes bacterium GWC2_40_13]OFX74317.1 MAG: hypothetical protein A2W96_13410 [Bacteroidetes bacterium GWD2_40_43]OFX90948.1 MAG: hypothetical protein A2W97_07950 [Bacteroidetes bacterium GWE2_40_63]OFY21162.1 MAG: hypothetical protein A2W88_18925 [Bacteroidetes bacterium GWF2_40_13]OFZ25360.1 MAG: hypothetical protein A2437_01375 [Bacteroidetes bacterium RIFOXYC
MAIMETTQQTSKQFFNIVKIIHVALLGGTLIFASIVLYLVSGKPLITEYRRGFDVFYLMVGAFAIWAIFGSQFMYSSQLKRVQPKHTLSNKLMHYQSANIIRYALIEGSALFSIVAALLTLTLWFFIITLLLSVMLAYHYPSVEKAIRDLHLNIEEQHIIKNPNAVISDSSTSQNERY